MISLCKFTIAAALSTFGLVGFAQTPVDNAANRSEAAASTGGQAMPMGGSGDAMARMDEQMKVMREMRDKMMQAKTPEERNALMAEHRKVMQDGMAMMGTMASETMSGKPGMGGMGATQGKGPMAGDMATRQQLMEKRMDMMQSMMQMMMDRLPQGPAKQ